MNADALILTFPRVCTQRQGKRQTWMAKATFVPTVYSIVVHKPFLNALTFKDCSITKSDLCSILVVCCGELVKESKSKKNELAAKLKAKVEGNKASLGADASPLGICPSFRNNSSSWFTRSWPKKIMTSQNLHIYAIFIQLYHLFHKFKY